MMRQDATHIITEQITRRLRGEDGEESRVNAAARVQQLEKLIHIEGLLSRPNVIFTPHLSLIHI